jgi:hypothetical protein
MPREEMIELANGLREAADWLEANADLPPSVWRSNSVHINCDTREEFQAVARALGTFDKHVQNGLQDFEYTIERKFSPTFGIQVAVSKGKICRKVRVMREVDAYECEDSILAPLGEVESLTE